MRARLASVLRGFTSLGRTRSAVLVAANFSRSGIGLVTGVVTARVLGPEGRGDLAVLTYWPAVLALLLELGVADALTLHVSRQRERLAAFLSGGVIVSLLLSGIGAVAGFFALPVLLRENQTHLLEPARAYLVFVPVSLLASVATGALLGIQRFHAVAAARVTAGLAYLIAIVIASVAGSATPELIAWLSLISAGGPLPIAATILASGRVLSGWQRPALKEQVSSGMNLQVARLASSLPRVEDRGIATVCLSQEQIGVYQIPSALAFVVPVVPQALAQLMFSRYGHVLEEERRDLVYRAYVRSVVLSAAIAAAGVPLMPVVIPLVYGASFGAAVVPSAIVVVAGVFGAGAMVLQAAARAELRIRAVLLSEVAAAVSMALAATLLVTWTGLVGLAFSYLVGRLVAMTWMAYAKNEVYAAVRADLLPWSQAFRAAVIADIRAVGRTLRTGGQAKAQRERMEAGT